MKFSGLRAAALRCGSAATKAELLKSQRATFSFFRPGRDISRSRPAKNFLVVGAYPPNGTYDECLPDPDEHAVGARRVKKVGLPRKDPLFGTTGALFRYWKPAR